LLVIDIAHRAFRSKLDLDECYLSELRQSLVSNMS
jgi:hypothetical protein